MEREHTELIVDIGSASVGTCFATGNADQKPVLSSVKRVALGAESGAARSGIQELALKALKEAVQAMPATPIPQSVQVVLAAPWYAAEIQTILSQSEKPIRIGKATVDHVIEKHRKENPKEHRAGRRKIESLVTQAYVNDYPTALKKAVRGTSLKVSLYETEADAAFVSGVENVLKDAFPHARLAFHTCPFLSFAVLRVLKEEDNFIFIDAGGEITDVLVAHRDNVTFLGSFPQGSLSFVRKIAAGGSTADAASRLTLFSKNELSTEESARFQEAFDPAASSWAEEYQKIMDDVLTLVPVPRAVFLASDKEPLLWFQKIFSMSDSAWTVRPVLITPEFFQEHVALGEDAVFDSFLSLEALFFKMEKQGLVKA